MHSNISVYIGRAGTGKSTSCFNYIKNLLEQNCRDNILLLVPDPSAYKVERALAEYLPQKGFHSVMVVGMSRLKSQVFKDCGIPQGKTLSKAASNLLLRNIIKEHESNLTIFRTASRKHNFAATVKDLIDEFRSFDISPQALETAPVQSSLLKQKLHDLGLIADNFQKARTELLDNVVDEIEQLIDLVPISQLTKNAHVIIDGFQWFTPQQERLIYALLANSKTGILTLTLDDNDYYRKAGSLFSRSFETFMNFKKRFANFKTVRFTDYKRGQNVDNKNELAIMERDFFNIPIKKQPEPLYIPMYEAYNANIEADFICRHILAMMEANPALRWRDFCVMLRSFESHGDALEKAFSNYDIPFFADRSQPMTTHPLSELIEGLFDLATSGFGFSALFRILKTDLVAISRSNIDELENYCLEFGITERHWLSDGDWTRLNKKAEDITTEDEAYLDRINAIKNQIVALFKPFYTFAQKSHSGLEWCNEIYALSEKLNIPTTLNQWQEEHNLHNDLVLAKAQGQIYKHFIELLDEINLICGHKTLNVEEIAIVFKEGFAELSYSSVPPTLDHVILTTIDRSYANDYNIVFVPGLNDGIFPQKMKNEGILLDKERDELKLCGLNLEAGAMIKSFNENYLLYLALTRANKQLILSYASTTINGEALEPSLPLKRLQQNGYVQFQKFIGLDIDETEHYIWRPKQSLNLLSQQLTAQQAIAPIWHNLYAWAEETAANTNEDNSFIKDKLDNILRSIQYSNKSTQLSNEIVQKLLLNNDALSGSVTRLEKYNQCPFSFFARYILKAEPRRERKLAAPEIGIFLHENLKFIGLKLLEQNKNWQDVSPAKMSELIETTISTTAQEIAHGLLDESAYYQNIKERLRKILQRTVNRLQLWASRSSFKMLNLEQSFGQKYAANSWSALKLPLAYDKVIRLNGQIDRIDYLQDEYTSQALIIDYKSSSQTKITAEDIYYGLKMQLLTYLMALENAQQHGELNLPKAHKAEILPAALVYTYLENPIKSVAEPLTLREAEILAEKELVKNSGYFQKNVDTLCHLDSEVLSGESPFVPIMFKKDGDFHSRSLNSLKTNVDFKSLQEYTKQKIIATGNKILNGDFPIFPYKKNKRLACTYCSYHTLCQLDPSQDSYTYNYLNTLPEDAALEKITQELQAKEVK